MPIEVRQRYQDPLLHVTASGGFTLNSAKETLLHTLKAAKEHQATGVLVDCRLIESMGSDVDLFYYAKTVVAGLKVLDTRLRLAYVFDSEDPTGQRKFAEGIATDRGADVRVFDSIDQAQEWLSR